MSQIPPRIPPQPLGYAVPSQPEFDLKRVASQQRALMLCILVEIFIMIAMSFAKKSGMLPLAIALSLSYVIVAIAAAVFIFMLAITLYNTGAGILLGILTLIPLVGLIVLLIVNGKATNTLRASGIKVGILGADPSTIRPGTIAGPPTRL